MSSRPSSKKQSTCSLIFREITVASAVLPPCRGPYRLAAQAAAPAELPALPSECGF